MSKKIFLGVLISVFMFTANLQASTDPSASLSGKQIMQRQDQINKGFHDEKAAGKMVLVNPKGKETIREFEYKQLEKNMTEGFKAMIKIEKPADLQGTGLLSHQNQGRPDDQWLYLPALKKTKRITGSAKSGRFIGSEFTFEDLSPKEVDDFDHKLLRDEVCGNVTCHVVESVNKTGDSNYSKTVTWVHSITFQNVKLELYNKKGALTKRALFEDYKRLGEKFWRPYKVTMKDLVKKRETRLEFNDIKVSAGQGATDFTKKMLER
jgi:hypothetical protein